MAIIDIGSNSVRLVVYAGAQLIPTPIFTEKVVARLGADFQKSRTLPQDAREKARGALRRFKLVIDDMNVSQPKVVATAAIRDAEDGAAFIDEVANIGFEVQLLSAEEEAHIAGEGVRWAIPDAHGIVGDLGGGSLELIDILGLNNYSFGQMEYAGGGKPNIPLKAGDNRIRPVADLIWE